MQQSEKGYGHIAKVGQDGKYTYEQYYPERKRVIVSQLHEGTHWKKFSAHAEVIVQETICNEFGLTKGKHTEGYAPEYDYLINNKKVEQKISLKQGLQIEFSTYDGRPSGINLTSADYHVYVTPCWSTKANKFVGKVRLYKTSDLLKVLGKYDNYDEDSRFVKVFSPTDSSPGSRVLSFEEYDLHPKTGILKGTLGSKNVDININMLEVSVIEEKGKRVGFDFNFPQWGTFKNYNWWLQKELNKLF